MSTQKVVLALELWQDIRRYIVVYFVMLLVVISAFLVIYCTHVHRQSTSKLEVLLNEKDELDIEFRNLVLEQNSLAEHSAIESKARKILNMVKPTTESEIIIKHK
jgi:cell division protein FtsL